MTSAHLSFALSALVLAGCGTREPSADGTCPDGKRAYSEKPLLESCEHIQTLEGIIDPRTGKREKVHRDLYCCK